MKKIIVILLATLLGSTTIMATEYGHILRRDIDPAAPDNGYPGGSTFTSLNGRFQLRMQGDGYLTLSELTAYGPIKRWQFPADGRGTPGERVILYTCYDGSCVGDKYDLQIGDFAAGKHIVYRQPGRAGWLTVGDDGNLLLYKEGGVLAWASNTTDAQVYGTASYHPCASQGKNLFFPRPFKDEYNTNYFSTGFISMRDQCTVSQSSALVTFSALQYVELLPGFQTTVSGTGAVVIKPIAQVATLPAARQNITEEVVPPAETKFAIYPNPTSGILTVNLDPGDKIKKITISNAAGILMAQYQGVMKFSIEKMPAGTYLYKIETDKQHYTGKIIKE